MIYCALFYILIKCTKLVKLIKVNLYLNHVNSRTNTLLSQNNFNLLIMAEKRPKTVKLILSSILCI